ncbi:uncharacterized protein DDB_G0271670-like isoform X2 [Mangifera indica]|uniref:uncharacterized protein DDB_G0271670-like isoform X2 n=1 Tax=Mangifera indica TaxID=29780 RepID=UPI001CFA825A|nr:uncharacterized protein DDB_G0271670-like isoform X2 [Mangifera indica]
MAAEVTSFLRLKQERSSNSEILITKDLLAGLSKVSDSESNLDSKQHGERAVRCNSPNTPLSSISASEDSENKKNDRHETKPEADFQDLNHFLEETCLDLKLQSSTRYQSVCTLDKVKSALQRAQKQALERKRPPSSSSSSFSPSSGPLILSASSSFSSSSSSSGPGMFAAGCPGCLFYVITLKANPRCPHCNATVPSPVAVKKVKLDLNSSC